MHDFNPFADIKKLLEDHTKKEIKDLSTSELRKLRKKYLQKGTAKTKKEVSLINAEIQSRGQDEDGKAIDEQVEKLHEIEGRRRPYKRPTTTEFLARLKKQKEEEAKKKEEKEEKKPVSEQNEDLLVILDVLCEMAGLDMMTLIEETRKEMENLGHAYGWDQRAPAGEPHGKLAANARDVIVKANMARLGKRKERGALKTGEETAYKIEMGGPDALHEPTAKQRAAGAPAAKFDPNAYDKVQDSIEKISDKFTMKRARQNAFDAMKPFALQPKPKGKGKGKK